MIGIGFTPAGNQPVPKFDASKFVSKPQAPAGGARTGGPGMSPSRARLVQSLLDATGSQQQEIQGPWQALGSVANQMAQTYLKKQTGGQWGQNQRNRFQPMQRQRMNIKKPMKGY